MFSHINKKNLPHMVDITEKPHCIRTAVAQTNMILDRAIMEQLHNNDINTPKGPVFATAIVAGITAVKNTASLIPMCHPIPISHCDIDISPHNLGLTITCAVSSFYATGVEIEAITGCSIAAITIYDMCKSITNNMLIQETKLISKEKISHENNC